MPRPIAWLVIAAFTGTWIWLIADRWRQVGLTGLLSDAGLVVLVAIGMVSVVAFSLLVGTLAARVRKYLFPIPPPWKEVRIVHQHRDRDDYNLLIARLEKLDQPTSHERVSVYRDRETGQLWQRTEWDVGHSSAGEFVPIDDVEQSQD